MKIMAGYHSKIHIGYRRCYWLPHLLAVGRKMRNKKIFTAERSGKDSRGRDMQPSLFIRLAGGSSPEHSCLSIFHIKIIQSAVRQLKLRFPSGSPGSSIWNRDEGPSSYTNPPVFRNPEGSRYEGLRAPKPSPANILRNDSTIPLMSGDIETNLGPRQKVPIDEQAVCHICNQG